jgi:competence protein ComEA
MKRKALRFALLSVAVLLVLAGAMAFAQKTVDLNTASEKELEALKGVGKATAAKIVANRPYKSVDELSKAGLSQKKIDAIRGQVTVGGGGAVTAPAPTAAAAPKPTRTPRTSAPPAAPATASSSSAPAPKTSAHTKEKLAPGEKVNLNTASKEKLDELPGIGPVKAQAILDGRPYARIEDVMKVKGIKEKEFAKIRDLITVQ